MANGAFKFKDIYGNTLSYISGSGTNIHFSGGTLDLSGMTGITLGNLTLSGTTQNATSASHAASYLLTSSFNTYSGSFAITGSNLFKGNQTISGSIIPAVTNTYDLGSPTNNFRHLYLSSASLYIDGTKVLGSTSQELQITTDVGQSFKILEAGSDNITLQSADGNIELKSSGGGDVIVDPTNGIIALKGTVTIYTGNKIVSSDGNAIQFGNGITVTGSIFSTVTPLVSGSSQITYNGLSGIPSGIISSSTQITSQGYATTGSNNFQGTQTITGSLYISQNLVVQGSSSLQDITGSNVYIGTNKVNLNTNTPAIRFGGISVFDSGSNFGQSGSLLWDSLNNHWLYQQPSGSLEGYNSAILIAGPKNSGALGEETTLTEGKIVLATGEDHIGDSIITQTNGAIGVSGSLSITGSVVATGTSLVSSSTQIDVLSTTNIARLATTGSNIFTSNQTITGSITSTTSITATNFISNGTTLYGVTLKGRVADNYGAVGFYSSDGLTRYGYIQSHSTNGGQIIVNGDGGGQLILDNRGLVATSALSGSSATFSGSITAASGVIESGGFNIKGAGATAKPNMLRLSNASDGGYYWDMWRDNTTGYLNFGGATGSGLSTFLTIKDVNGNTGIGYASPVYQLQVLNTIGLRANSQNFQAIKGTGWGYSPTGYKVVMIGDDNTANFTTVSIGYDPSGNSNGAFNGNGKEVLFRNGASFATPTSANTAFHLNTLVLKDGNIGIGTDAPTALLHLSGGSPYLYIDDTSTTGTKRRFQMVIGDVGTTQSANFGFNNTSGTSLNDVLTINELGRVGINTATPIYRFQVAGGYYFNGGDANTGYTSDGLWGSTATPSLLGSSGYGGTSTKYGNTGLLIGYQDNGAGLYSPAYGFEVKSTDGRPVTGNVVKAIVMKNTDTNTYPFYINNNGSAYFANNVGVDTTSPDTKLHVNGNIKHGGRIFSGAAIVGNISTNLNSANGTTYILVCNLNDAAGWSLVGHCNAASYTCWNISQIWIQKNYSSTACSAGITGLYKSGCNMTIVDLNYGGGRYIAIGYTSNPEIDVVWSGYNLLQSFASDGGATVIGAASVTVNSTLATY